MKKLFFLLIILAAGLLQATLLAYFKVAGVKPDLLLISVVIASLYFEFKWAILFSMLAGILKDALGVSGFGINTLLFSLWAYFVIRLSKKISMENNFMPALSVFIIMIVNDIAIKAVSFSLANLTVPLGIFLRIAILESIYTALIFPLAFRIIEPVLNFKR